MCFCEPLVSAFGPSCLGCLETLGVDGSNLQGRLAAQIGWRVDSCLALSLYLSYELSLTD